jgi:predicted alpha/beta hydrolase
VSATLTLRARDGTALAAALFEPPQRAQGAVLVAGALGVGQRFYAPFAAWLAERGQRVLTFDLRGIGASRAPQHAHSLRGLDADLLTWAQQDFAAAVECLEQLHGGAPIALVGHSLGLHHAAMTLPRVQSLIARAVGVAAGAGSWRTWAAPSRWRAPLMLHVAGPLLVPLFGYFPGRALGMVGDLPAPAFRQWSRWCRNADFAWGCEPERVQTSVQAARFAIEAFSFTDDEAMTEGNTRVLLAAMPNAPSRVAIVAPADVGLARIGHLGAFRRESAALWPRLEAALTG